MHRCLLLLAATVAVLLVAAPAWAADTYGCDAEMTYSQCIAQDPTYGGDATGTSTSTLCVDTYGCRWCDLTQDETRSICDKHQYASGWCSCSTTGGVGRNIAGDKQPLCTLKGSCRYGR